MSPASALASTSNAVGSRFVRSRSTASRSYGRYQRSAKDFLNSFYAVLRRWESETMLDSNPERITAHPSYVALVQNAELALPWIIAELRLHPSKLVWVLDDAFPNETVYSAEAVGDLHAMTDGWIAWAENNGRSL
jgi:hypothetical protein